MNAVFTPQRTRISVEQFQRMGEAGIFGPEERIELIEGELLNMAPIGTRHVFAVDALTWMFHEAVPRSRARVSTQSPVVLGRFSEPQPDLLLLRQRAGNYLDATPRAEDVLLLIEVADTTLRYDRGRKLPLYAREGVQEVWILDIQARRLEVWSDLQSGRYASHRALGQDELASPRALPEIQLRWGEALG